MMNVRALSTRSHACFEVIVANTHRIISVQDQCKKQNRLFARTNSFHFKSLHTKMLKSTSSTACDSESFKDKILSSTSLEKICELTLENHSEQKGIENVLFALKRIDELSSFGSFKTELALDRLDEHSASLCSSLSPGEIVQCLALVSDLDVSPGPATSKETADVVALFQSMKASHRDVFSRMLADQFNTHSSSELELISKLSNVLGISCGSKGVNVNKLPSRRQSSYSGFKIFGRAKAFWREKLLIPASNLTTEQLGLALGAGIWGGIFPVPGVTTAAVGLIIAGLRLVGCSTPAPAVALAVAVNLALTPLQVNQAWNV